jgi:hypothetical protein
MTCFGDAYLLPMIRSEVQVTGQVFEWFFWCLWVVREDRILITCNLSLSSVNGKNRNALSQPFFTFLLPVSLMKSSGLNYVRITTIFNKKSTLTSTKSPNASWQFVVVVTEKGTNARNEQLHWPCHVTRCRINADADINLPCPSTTTLGHWADCRLISRPLARCLMAHSRLRN